MKRKRNQLNMLGLNEGLALIFFLITLTNSLKTVVFHNRVGKGARLTTQWS